MSRRTTRELLDLAISIAVGAGLVWLVFFVSASEKLKALEPIHMTVKAGSTDSYPVGAVTFYDVPLPHIVAVVQEAEIRAQVNANFTTLRAALADLEEALK